MAAGEVEHAVYQFVSSLGRGAEWDPEEFDSVASVIPAFKFAIFLTVLESKYAIDVDEGGLRESIKDVHDFYLLDVIKKVGNNSLFSTEALGNEVLLFRATWASAWTWCLHSRSISSYCNLISSAFSPGGPNANKKVKHTIF